MTLFNDMSCPRFRAAWIVILATALAGCDADEAVAPRTPTGFGRAYGIWTPSPRETCTKEQHDAYSAMGPNDKLYPTWHPPNDPVSGCSFGHDHGRDPRGSDLSGQVGPMPFGYANDQLDIHDPNGQRHEDHVGHKVEWENDVEMNLGEGVAGQLLRITCDVLTKLHQGTHSRDAFTNNLHELIYHIRCTDGSEMHVTIMAAIGNPGEFKSACDNERTVVVGPATPANSPRGGGQRIIPDRGCIDRFILVGPGQNSDYGALNESWQTSNSIRADNGRTIASFDPYYQVRFPARFFDPSMPQSTGRIIDACYMTEANGDRARGGMCDASTNGGQITGILYDDPRSPFNGVRRVVDINGNRINNADGPSVWYSNPFGGGARTTAFPGSIRQVISKVNNLALDLHGPTLGGSRNYGGPGVRAPN